MIGVPSVGTPAPGLRRPLARIAASGGGGPAPAAAAAAMGVGTAAGESRLLSLRMTAGAAPGVDSLDFLMHASAAADFAPGDELSVALGYEDDDATGVFTGTVDGIHRALDGTVGITLLNPGAALARLRLRRSFERQSPGEIVRDLAGTVGVRTGAIENGAPLAFFALDDRRGAWATIADLALRCGVLARIDPEGKLHFAAGGGGSPIQTFRYGEDILDFRVTRRQPAVGSVTVHGEGAAGGQGQDAWGWLIKDPGSVTASAGSGTPERFVSDGALRSAEGVEGAAAALLAAAAARQATARLHVPGAPRVTVGATVELSTMPDPAMDGTYLVTGVRHDYGAPYGFRTRLDLTAPPVAGSFPGGFP